MSFVKIKNKIFVGEYQRKDFIISYANKISYYKTIGADYLLSIIPEKFRNQFSVIEMSVVGSIPPHTDSNISCAINFYIKSGNYETKFFDVKSGVVNTYQVKGQTNGVVYSYNDVVFTKSFIAKDGDVYLLDVTKPHSVVSHFPSNRLALCLHTNTFSFEEVKNFLTLENVI